MLEQPPTWMFAAASAAAWLVVVAAAAIWRTRAYAMFRGVLLGIQILIAMGLWSHLGVAWPLFAFAHATTFLSALMLIRPRMRPFAYRVLVSWPEATYQAGTLLAMPWAIAFAVGFSPPGFWAGYALAAIGLMQSLIRRPHETIDLVVTAGDRIEGVRRAAHGGERVERPLCIAQITDPHLGPFMSVERLARISARIVENNPDLVLLTGDFLTMESQSDPELLTRGLAPLKALEGRVFACFGNHDLEAPLTVRKALAATGARLLIDDAAVVDTPAGRVQILGVDFRWRGRAEHLRQVCEAHPRQEGALRMVLLHDPAAFRHLPEGEGDLVLSGHTHGGQLGLVSLGLPTTFVSLVTSSPDHGLWGRGRDRLYVHRGTAHYGFPVRLGVPSEESLLRVHAPLLAAEHPESTAA
jgi:predicted MPP superfamily phosphohydrolase